MTGYARTRSALNAVRSTPFAIDAAGRRSTLRPASRPKRSWLAGRVLAIFVGACIGAPVALAPVPAQARRHVTSAAPALDAVRVSELPPEGRDMLARIRAGGPFVSRRDGIPFGNRERLLPAEPRGYYAEYTVPTPGAGNRGARRIVAGRGTTGDFRTSNEYYYSNDHYQSFRRIVQ